MSKAEIKTTDTKAYKFWVKWFNENGYEIDNFPIDEVLQAYADQEVKAKLIDFVNWFNKNDATQGIIITRVDEYLNKLKQDQ